MNGRPTTEQLAAAAPLIIWNEAIKQAQRSPHKRHRTGCVLYYGMDRSPNPKIYSVGCSHPHDGGMKVWSIHAEMDAIARLNHRTGWGGAVAMIVTLTPTNSFAANSKPCQNCLDNLKRTVWGIVYAERANDGSWIVRKEDPKTMQYAQPTKYQDNAREYCKTP